MLLNMMLLSTIDCDKTLLALELVVDLSPMLNVIVELLALLYLLEECGEVSSVESDFAEVADDDFMPSLLKNDQITQIFFISCFWHSLST